MTAPRLTPEQKLAVRELAVTHGCYTLERNMWRAASITWAKTLQRQQRAMGVEVVPDTILKHQIAAWHEKQRLLDLSGRVEADAQAST